jgi:hypothetical protein
LVNIRTIGSSHKLDSFFKDLKVDNILGLRFEENEDFGKVAMIMWTSEALSLPKDSPFYPKRDGFLIFSDPTKLGPILLFDPAYNKVITLDFL